MNKATEALTAKALIVDDVEKNRDLLKDYLYILNLTVSTAINGREAINHLENDSFDVVVLDIMMPVMDGHELIAVMKANQAWASIPVIVLSALDDMQSIVRAIELGADDYITKPFDPKILNARVRACLQTKQLRDQERQHQKLLSESYQALQESERSREALTGMFIHDLNNPLASIKGFAHVASLELSNPQPDTAKLARCLSLIESCGKDLTTLINGILDVSRLESGQMRIHMEAVDLSTLTKRICENYQGLAKLQGIALSTDTGHSPYFVTADATLLTRIIENLIVNALKYGQSKTQLTISATDTGVVLDVANDGPEIPAEILARVFEKFFQYHDRSGSKKRYGVGLGLAFCKMASERQNVQIEACSLPNDLTHFRVKFQLTKDPT